MSDKNLVGSLREIVQDLLVPEVKEIKAELAAIRADIKHTNDALREEIQLRHENLELLIKHGDQRNEQAIRSLTEKLDDRTEFRERLAAIEARMPRQ